MAWAILPVPRKEILEKISFVVGVVENAAIDCLGSWWERRRVDRVKSLLDSILMCFANGLVLQLVDVQFMIAIEKWIVTAETCYLAFCIWICKCDDDIMRGEGRRIDTIVPCFPPCVLGAWWMAVVGVEDGAKDFVHSHFVSRKIVSTFGTEFPCRTGNEVSFQQLDLVTSARERAILRTTEVSFAISWWFSELNGFWLCPWDSFKRVTKFERNHEVR